MFTSETGQKADGGTSVAETRVMAWALSIISVVAETWCPKNSVDKSNTDNTSVRTACRCKVFGDLYPGVPHTDTLGALALAAVMCLSRFAMAFCLENLDDDVGDCGFDRTIRKSSSKSTSGQLRKAP